MGEHREQTTLSCPLKSRQGSSVGKPNIILGNGEVFLARLTNRLGRRSNAVPDDFINRFAGRTEIKVIVRRGRHGTRFPQVIQTLTNEIAATSAEKTLWTFNLDAGPPNEQIVGAPCSSS